MENLPLILVVDDDPDIRQLLHHVLETDFQVSHAANADEALASLRARRPDGVILDVMMPGSANGFDLCRQVKDDPALHAIHVVILTARGLEADLDRSARAGADAHFVKPFVNQELLAYLKAHITQK